MDEMKEILEKYRCLLQRVDGWFAHCAEKEPAAIQCRSGCSECCRGLFDITLLDAYCLKSGFDQLEPAIRASVLAKVRNRLVGLRILWPDFHEPYILNYRPEEEWELLMPEDDETPCSLLGENGKCLVYDHRPMTCRLHGLPLVDLSGEVLFDEWCTLNFTGTDPMDIPGLRWEFNRLFRDELQIFREFTDKLLNHRMNELDTFVVTALLIDFERFNWKEWLEKSGLLESGK